MASGKTDYDVVTGVFNVMSNSILTMILASGKTDYHCKVKEILFIRELQPALNANVSSEKLLLY